MELYTNLQRKRNETFMHILGDRRALPGRGSKFRVKSDEKAILEVTLYLFINIVVAN